MIPYKAIIILNLFDNVLWLNKTHTKFLTITNIIMVNICGKGIKLKKKWHHTKALLYYMVGFVFTYFIMSVLFNYYISVVCWVCILFIFSHIWCIWSSPQVVVVELQVNSQNNEFKIKILKFKQNKSRSGDDFLLSQHECIKN